MLNVLQKDRRRLRASAARRLSSIIRAWAGLVWSLGCRLALHPSWLDRDGCSSSCCREVIPLAASVGMSSCSCCVACILLEGSVRASIPWEVKKAHELKRKYLWSRGKLCTTLKSGIDKCGWAKMGDGVVA